MFVGGGSVTPPIPGDLQYLQPPKLDLLHAPTQSDTAAKFCTKIKLDEWKIFTGRTTLPGLDKMFCDATAHARSVCVS